MLYIQKESGGRAIIFSYHWHRKFARFSSGHWKDLALEWDNKSMSGGRIRTDTSDVLYQDESSQCLPIVQWLQASTGRASLACRSVSSGVPIMSQQEMRSIQRLALGSSNPISHSIMHINKHIPIQGQAAGKETTL